MRRLKAGLILVVVLYLLTLVVLFGAFLIDQVIFRVARLISPETASSLSPVVVGLVSLAVVGGLLALLVPRLRRSRWPRLSTGLAVVSAGIMVVTSASSFPYVSGTIVSDEVTAAAIAVARPACRGVAVQGAGSLITGTATVNHLVVLDMEGNDHEWTGSPPSTWSPSSLGDLEVMVCVDREETSVVAQVCNYSGGPDITRHTAQRHVRIVVPATGQTLANLTVSDKARACDQTERQDLTDLYGSVSWEQVRTQVVSWLRDNGAATGEIDS